MKIRFQADADLRVPIIKGLRRREPSIDFMTANEALLGGIDDWTVLVSAASNRRLLVSHDVSTIPETFARFIQNSTSPGVILILRNYPIAKPSKDYCEFGQIPRLRIGRMYCHSCLDETAASRRL